MAPDLEDDCSFYIQQIKSGSITADEFDLYWRKCASFRFKQIIESKSTSEIFNIWPEYIKPSGFLLIDIDFSLKFSNAKSLQERWSQFGDKIICFLKTKISNASGNESKIFLTFLNMHHLFPPPQKVQTDESGAKIRKKHSIADSQDGFVMMAGSKEEQEAKISLLKLQGRNIQPKLMIIGEMYKI